MSTVFRIPQGLLERIDALAAAAESTRSEIIRQILEGLGAGTIVPQAADPEVRVSVRADDIVARASDAVREALGSERRLNAAVIEALRAYVDRAERDK